MINYKVALLSALFLSACAHRPGQHDHHEDHSSCTQQSCSMKADGVDSYLKHVGPDVIIGKLPAKTFKHMSFGAQPSKEDLNAAKSMGYETIINIRSESEIDWNVGEHVKSLGMSYYNVPLLNVKGEIDPNAVDKLEKIHKDTHKQKQLIFCSSGNRAAAWMAAHLMVKHKLSADDSIVVAEKLGLTKDDVKFKVKNFEKTLK